jgi:RNA polymerase sigma factor (sigma-70 family)
MHEGNTTASVQRYLDALAGDGPAEPIVRELLERSVRRLQKLCANLLHRRYSRLMQPPLNLEGDEMLGAVVERLLKALRATRPTTVRGFFALANQHMRWELNDLARRLDNQPAFEELPAGLAAEPARSDSSRGTFSADQLLQWVEKLPGEEREIFGLVRIQGLSHAEAAEVLGIGTKTVQRRLRRTMLQLKTQLQEVDIESFKAQ